MPRSKPVAIDIDGLMRLWPTVADFARDIGVKPTHAQTMRVRGSIPVEYWPRVISAAKEREIEGVTSDLLMQLHVPEAAAGVAR